MSDLTFSFDYTSTAASPPALTVLRFSGVESMSSLYRFEVYLQLDDLTTSLDLVNVRSALKFYSDGTEVRVIRGIVTEVEDIKYSSSTDGSSDFVVMKVILQPELVNLSFNDKLEIYPRAITDSGETIDATLTTILSDIGWTLGVEYRLNLSNIDRAWMFRMQYGETQFDFMQRILQREGIFYYFEDTGSRERVVFTDSNAGFSALDPATLRYQSQDGFSVVYQSDTVQSFNAKTQAVPSSVSVSNSNDEYPSRSISHTATIDAAGAGQVDMFGLNLLDDTEATTVANIYANSYLCRKNQYLLESEAYSLSPGFYFNLTDHGRTQFNSLTYVLESVSHSAAVEDALLRAGLAVSDDDSNYITNCVTVDKSMTYAPSMNAEKPTIQSSLLAQIDGPSGQTTPQLDDHGRYRVKFLFDQQTRTEGKYSYLIRKLESYGGAGEGNHFPLLPGTRVLIGFIGNDPDLPVIIGTVSDSSTQTSVVSSANNTVNMMKSAAGNRISMDDTNGACEIVQALPGTDDFVKLSQPSGGDGKGYELKTTGIEQRTVVKGQNLSFATEFMTSSVADFSFPRLNYHGQAITDPSISSAADFTSYIGPTYTSADGEIDSDSTLAPLDRTSQSTANVSTRVFTDEEQKQGRFIFEKRYGHRFEWSRGNRYVFGEDRLYDFGNAYEEYHTYQDGIDINEEHFDIPPVSNALDAAVTPPPVPSDEEIAEGFAAELTATKLEEAEEALAKAAAEAAGITDPPLNWYDCGRHDRPVNPSEHTVYKRWGDQFCYHYGRRFEWCDAPADYNFSNGYTENLIKSNVEIINADHPHDAARPSGPNYDNIYGNLVAGLKSGETVATKTIGNTYDYRYGQNLSIIVGDSEEEVHGDTYSKITGDSECEVHGLAKTLHYGGSENCHYGYAKNHYEGGFSDTYLGGTSCFHVGGASSIYLGLVNTMHAGAVIDMFTGLHLRLNYSAGIDVNVAYDLKFKTMEFRNQATVLKSRLTALKTDANDLSSSVNTLSSKVNDLEKSVAKIDSTQITINQSTTNIAVVAVINLFA